MLSASCTIRYADRSTPAGIGRGTPMIRDSTTRPASARPVEQFVEAVQAGLRQPLGRLVVVAEQPDHPAGLGERLAGGVPEHLERLLGGR